MDRLDSNPTRTLTTLPGRNIPITSPDPTLVDRSSSSFFVSASSSSLENVVTSSSSTMTGRTSTSSAASTSTTYTVESVIANAQNSSQKPGLSPGSEKAVIAITTIGGTLILLLLLYAFYRRRRGATYSEIVRFRRHSGTIILDSGSRLNANLTALPIYRETRFSLRSSRQASTLDINKTTRRPSGIPSPIAKSFQRQNPWIEQTWKTSGPLSPMRERHPLSSVQNASQQVQVPELARVSTMQSFDSGMTQKSVDDTTKPAMFATIREESPSPVQGEAGSMANPQASELDPENRWSWTNPEAPPTPRFRAPSLHSSISTLPRFLSVKSWVRNQSDRRTHRSESPPPVPAPPRTAAFKNKATKPLLAPPKPVRKLSKRRTSSNDVNDRPSTGQRPTTPPGQLTESSLQGPPQLTFLQSPDRQLVTIDDRCDQCRIRKGSMNDQCDPCRIKKSLSEQGF